MMKLKEVFCPSLLVSESFYPLLTKEEELYDTVRKILLENYYSRIETGSLKNPEIRKKFIDLVKELHIGFTQWITNDINEKKLNPSTTDDKIRKKTILEINNLIDIAAESGADRVAMISGPDPGEQYRKEAMKGIEEVLFAVSEKMAEYPGMILLLEPLDRGAHKNNLIGPSTEATDLMKKVNGHYKNCYLSWDSAHVALNKEDLRESLEICAPYIGHLHLANAILDPKKEGYGDWHMAMGEPGFLDVAKGQEILKNAAQIIAKPQGIGVAVESRCQVGQDPLKNEKVCRGFLAEILEGECDEGQ